MQYYIVSNKHPIGQRFRMLICVGKRTCKNLNIMFARANRQKISFLSEGSVKSSVFQLLLLYPVLVTSFELYKETIPFSFFFSPLGMTFRHMLYPAYKSNRTPTPDTVVQGMQYLKASIKAMSIKVIEVKKKYISYAFEYLITVWIAIYYVVCWVNTQESSISLSC